MEKVLGGSRPTYHSSLVNTTVPSCAVLYTTVFLDCSFWCRSFVEVLLGGFILVGLSVGVVLVGFYALCLLGLVSLRHKNTYVLVIP